MRKCIKIRFKPLLTLKNIFLKDMILVVWKYAQMHQNTFLTTLVGKKYLFKKNVSGTLEVWANVLKHVFNLSRWLKIYILKKVSGGQEVCANASKHGFNHSRR